MDGLSVACISLPARADRRAALAARWKATREGHRQVVGVPAFEGGDDGCLRSHLLALDCSLSPVLILEDDACFAPDFTLDLLPPADWDVLWLGGQHRTRPIEHDETWVRPTRMMRTHAYIARDPRALAALMRLHAIPRMDPYVAALPLNQYVLRRHTVGQSAGLSDIDGRTRPVDQYWNGKFPEAFALAARRSR